MSKPADSSIYVAALLWDLPALHQSESDGARAFVDAMNLRHTDTEGRDDPLTVAARGILAEASGEAEAALDAYRSLSGSTEALIRLLGLCLLCWSDLAEDPRIVAEARGEIERLDDQELRARLTTKLIAAAFDHGWDELLPVLFTAARKGAPGGSMLRVMLEQEAHNLVGAPLPMDWTFTPDELTEYQWIRDLASSAAEATLVEEVKRRARSPWTIFFTFGAAPLNKPFAAEMQARWAGAIWLRRALQTQLSAHLLSGGASSAQEHASAVTLWALGGGQQVRDVIDLAEPHFDDDSADFVVRHLTRSGDVATNFNTVLVETALECWDLISDQTAISLLDRFRPTDSEHPVARQISTLWSVLSLRVPTAWAERFASLTDDEARALLATTTPAVAEQLPVATAERMYELATTSSLSVDGLLLVAALADRLGRADKYETEETMPAIAVIRLAWRDDSRIEASELGRAVADLTDQVGGVIADSRKGKSGLGNYNPFNALASGVAKLGEVPDETLNLIREAATDGGLPRNVRYDAVKVLSAAVSHGALERSNLDQPIESIPEAGAEPFWGEYSQALMRAAKVELAMAVGDVSAYLPQALVLSRDPETRVRLNAIDASVLGRRTSDEDMLESILLSALFDPSPEVIRHALDGFREKSPERIAAQTAVGQRLKELFGAAQRDVRAAIARLAASADLPEPLAEAGAVLLTRAEEDRSYEVRRAVQGSAEDK